MQLINDFKEILVTDEQIQEACHRLANEITEDYKDVERPLFLGLLKGCHPFMSDLLCQIQLYHEVDYMDVSSYYGGTKSKSEVKILKDVSGEVVDRDIIIVEDIVDSGKTIKKVKELLLFRGANSVKVVTMTDKPSGREVELVPEYVGYEVPSAFLIGYGLDYNELYRNVRAIGIPHDKIIKGE